MYRKEREERDKFDQEQMNMDLFNALFGSKKKKRKAKKKLRKAQEKERKKAQKKKLKELTAQKFKERMAKATFKEQFQMGNNEMIIKLTRQSNLKKIKKAIAKGEITKKRQIDERFGIGYFKELTSAERRKLFPMKKKKKKKLIKKQPVTSQLDPLSAFDFPVNEDLGDVEVEDIDLDIDPEFIFAVEDLQDEIDKFKSSVEQYRQ